MTTCSHQSSKIAAEGRDYVYSMDTRFVSVGQSLIAVEAAKYIEANPDATVEEIFSFVESVMDRVLLGFVPTDLAFLKVGGRLSNVAFLGAHLLKIKPCIEVTGGKFVATKKFRGSMLKCARAFLDHMVEKGDIDFSHIGLAYSVGLSEELRGDMEVYARELGFEDITWTQVGGVISSTAAPPPSARSCCKSNHVLLRAQAPQRPPAQRARSVFSKLSGRCGSIFAHAAHVFA